jgi:hypothetical protein
MPATNDFVTLRNVATDGGAGMRETRVSYRVNRVAIFTAWRSSASSINRSINFG